jgi:hypothetical protein
MKTKLRNLAGIVLPVLREPSVCEACGGPFTCGAKLSGCWCAGIQLSDETRAELKARYNNCLCRECLERLSGREQSHARASA